MLRLLLIAAAATIVLASTNATFAKPVSCNAICAKQCAPGNTANPGQCSSICMQACMVRHKNDGNLGSATSLKAGRSPCSVRC